MTDADLGAVLVAGDVLTHARTLHVQRLRGITHGTYCGVKRPRPPVQHAPGGRVSSQSVAKVQRCSSSHCVASACSRSTTRPR